MDTTETGTTYLELTHGCTLRIQELKTSDIKRAHFVPCEFRTQHFETPWLTFETGQVISYMDARQQKKIIPLSPLFPFRINFIDLLAGRKLLKVAPSASGFLTSGDVRIDSHCHVCVVLLYSSHLHHGGSGL